MTGKFCRLFDPVSPSRSEEHTSELQSQSNLVCRLLLEKKNHLLVERLRMKPAMRHHFVAAPHFVLCPSNFDVIPLPDNWVLLLVRHPMDVDYTIAYDSV